VKQKPTLSNPWFVLAPFPSAKSISEVSPCSHNYFFPLSDSKPAGKRRAGIPALGVADRRGLIFLVLCDKKKLTLPPLSMTDREFFLSGIHGLLVRARTFNI